MEINQQKPVFLSMRDIFKSVQMFLVHIVSCEI